MATMRRRAADRGMCQAGGKRNLRSLCHPPASKLPGLLEVDFARAGPRGSTSRFLRTAAEPRRAGVTVLLCPAPEKFQAAGAVCTNLTLTSHRGLGHQWKSLDESREDAAAAACTAAVPLRAEWLRRALARASESD